MRSLFVFLCGGAALSSPSLHDASPHTGLPRPPLSWAADPGAAVGPLRIAPELDCAVRGLALNFSAVLLPWADSSLVSDALRLEADCGAPPPTRGGGSSAAPNPVPAPMPGVASVFYADPVRGDDGAAGTISAPFRTIGRGLTATRGVTPGALAQLVLRAGTFVLAANGGQTLELTPGDSGLTVSAFPGESPVISGGLPLAGLAWTPAPAPSPPPPPPPMTPPVQGSLLCAPPLGCCVDAPGESHPGVCAALAQTASAAACAALCLSNATCTGYTWHSPAAGSFAQWCYARLDGIDDCDGAAAHTSGWKPDPEPPTAANIWQAHIPASASVRDFDQLFMNGRRLVRARFPNANPEVELSPAGYMNPVAWAPAATYPAPAETHVPGVRPYDPWFPNFQWGVNGTVANFTAGSFWGTRSPPAGAQYSVPSGVTMPAGVPSAGTWANVSEAIVHAFQGGHWGDWAFRVGSQSGGGALTFSRGGWQEARGGGGQAMYVEGARELLDVVGEWHYNASLGSEGTLTVAFNGTAHDGSETLIAAQLAELLRITGTRAAPVRNVTLAGLTFAHTLTDFFLPYTVPSGGDWSFHDGGALRLSGTEGVRVLSCVFDAPGGNALMLSGHNRATTIQGNSFAWTGSSAIVSAGTGGGELTGGDDFPEGTLIEGNLMREIAVYVKQSGALYQGVSANLTLRGNVMFNAARAAVNINDGFAGGHAISQNLIFNAVRETNDHGGINSWDRQPYAWRPWNASDVTALPMVERENFVINNYNGVWSLCHDDGSNAWVDENNFLPWSGTKNYLGFGKVSRGNYFLYADVSPQRLAHSVSPLGSGNGWDACAMSYGTAALPTALADVWTGNTCICSHGAAFFSFNGCNPDAPLDGNSPLFSNNIYASDDGLYAMKCGAQTWNLTQAQAHGVDAGSVLTPPPSVDEVVAAARALLHF